MYAIPEIERKLTNILSDRRYRHSIAVAYLASSLAMCYKEDAESAFIAGLLHDCAKYINGDEYLSICKEYGIEYTEYEKKLPSMLHAKVGAYLAEHEYGVKDKLILDAIINHIGGKPDMTFIEKAVYAADYIELWRQHLSLEDFNMLRSIVFKDIDKAIYLIADKTIVYLEENGYRADDLSYQMREFYRKQ